MNSTIAAFGSSNGKRDEKILEFRGLKPTHRACNLLTLARNNASLDITLYTQLYISITPTPANNGYPEAAVCRKWPGRRALR